MTKRYRRPKTEEGQLKMQMGMVDGEPDMCIYWGAGIHKCDSSFILYNLCNERLLGTSIQPSFLDELESRGYDLDTLRFSIEKKRDKL